MVISFQPSVIAEAKRQMPRHQAFLIFGFQQDEQTGIWSPTIEEIVAEAQAVKADGVDISADPPLDAQGVKKLRQAGLEVYAWTVDSPGDCPAIARFRRDRRHDQPIRLDEEAVRSGESITVAPWKGTVPFSSDENWDSPPVIFRSILSQVWWLLQFFRPRGGALYWGAGARCPRMCL